MAEVAMVWERAKKDPVARQLLEQVLKNEARERTPAAATALVIGSKSRTIAQKIDEDPQRAITLADAIENSWALGHPVTIPDGADLSKPLKIQRYPYQRYLDATFPGYLGDAKQRLPGSSKRWYRNSGGHLYSPKNVTRPPLAHPALPLIQSVVERMDTWAKEEPGQGDVCQMAIELIIRAKAARGTDGQILPLDRMVIQQIGALGIAAGDEARTKLVEKEYSLFKVPNAFSVDQPITFESAMPRMVAAYGKIDNIPTPQKGNFFVTNPTWAAILPALWKYPPRHLPNITLDLKDYYIPPSEALPLGSITSDILLPYVTQSWLAFDAARKEDMLLEGTSIKEYLVHSRMENFRDRLHEHRRQYRFKSLTKAGMSYFAAVSILIEENLMDQIGKDCSAVNLALIDSREILQTGHIITYGCGRADEAAIVKTCSSKRRDDYLPVMKLRAAKGGSLYPKRWPKGVVDRVFESNLTTEDIYAYYRGIRGINN